jgi:hypothetical protein
MKDTKKLELMIEEMPKDRNFPVGTHIYKTDNPDKLLIVTVDKDNPVEEDFVIPSSLMKNAVPLTAELFFVSFPIRTDSD